jgi:1,4-dihydroxy-2-naphthoyl-CoA hydrolase
VTVDLSELAGDGSPRFDSTLGVEYVEASGDRVVLSCPVQPKLHQPYGILHGGVHCSLVETAASIGAALWFGERGQVVGVSNHTNFLRAVRTGRITATATPIQRGRTQQLWQVDIVHDEDGKLAATGQVRLSNIPSADSLGQPG